MSGPDQKQDQRRAPQLPVLVVVDDDAQALEQITATLTDRYGSHYAIVPVDSASLPLGFETSMPRVFAVGDVRANSIKRVASAVGEGSVLVAQLHQLLADEQAVMAR